MMRWIYKLPLRLRSLLRKDSVEEELGDELGFHLEKLVEENVAKGMTPEEARHAARRELGGVEQIKEECRDTRRVNYIEDFIHDVRYGVRQLRRSPGFTAVAVVTLALGIGANTAIFSVVNAVLLRPLPYKDPSQLVWATERFAFNHGAATAVSPDFIGWKENNRVFQQIGAFGGGVGANMTRAGEPLRVSVTNVTTELFPMLGVQPIVGRTFLSSEGRQGQEHVALLNEMLWRGRFGAEPAIVGKTVQLDGTGYTIVGVMPASLRYPRADVWTPFALNGEAFSPQSPRLTLLTVIGRLKGGTTPGQAESNLQLIAEQMNRQYPAQAARFRSNVRVEVIRLHELLVQNVRSLLLILLAAVGFVLLIACANVANLLLSRGVARRREMAVRGALGARRLRLVRQLLTEGSVLAAAGGGLGVVAGFWAADLLKQLIPPNLPSNIRLDPQILLFVVGLASLAVILFGLAPAVITSHTHVSGALKEAGQGAGGSRNTHRFRGLLLVGEIALAYVLLMGAGLLARSFVRLTEVDLGFEPRHLLVATVQRPRTIGFDAPQHAAFYREVLERVRALPGVDGAAVTTHYPLGSIQNATLALNIQGAGIVHPAHVISVAAISPDFFQTMGIPLLKGRSFGDRDSQDAPRAVVLNESLAREAFKENNPLGQRISFGAPGAPWCEVVGVVSDTRNSALDKSPLQEIYVPYAQQPSFLMSVLIRTTGDPASLVGAVRKTVQAVDKNQPLSEVVTMDGILAEAVAPQWFKMILLGLFSLLALILAAVGIYGLISYTVIQRTNEIGVRLAMGAEPRDVLKLVVGQGLNLTMLGVALGWAGALALTRFLSSFLYAVKPTDPLTYIAVTLALTVVGLFASLIPALRATGVDPAVALRYE